MGDDAQHELERFEDLDVGALVRRAGEVDDADVYWRIVRELHRRGTRRIFDEVARLTQSDEPGARRFACDVLGQLGYEGGQPFGDRSLPLLVRICTEDHDPSVVVAAIEALGHLCLPGCLPHVLAHARHVDPEVRFAVAWAVPSIAGIEWLQPTDPVVATLMTFTSDEDSDVRDWATFGLGSVLSVDGEEVRRCLLARVDDPDEDTRDEAVVGLARRHVPGIARRVLGDLGADRVGRLTVSAAACLGDATLAEALARLSEWWDVDPDLLEQARLRCDPGRTDRTADLVAALLEAAEGQRVPVRVSSELLDDFGEPHVHTSGFGASRSYELAALMRRAGGSVDGAIGLIREDLRAG